ncbi:Uma2 family endonuclease [Lewinella sp. 4G2]|uniref:Uma2 family endonuclease n=1 Tax=Lewinella sp. 4G2 TaxID=1803372 RepID=UPI0007B4668C|nr:Uma2 family endonuclease [Lewinella sp. 4G2]OAV46087.1 hypothetical protein A3850_017645 [Lewinella sp. 4G2]
MGAEKIEDRKYSLEEYFKLCLASEWKYEFHDGTIYSMAGGKIAHNRTKKNVYDTLIKSDSTCTVFDSDVAVNVQSLNRYYFPDISVICGEVDTSDEGGIQRLFNGQLIIEVLSQSTAEKDRVEKLHAYARMDSFQEYILIDSRKCQIETFYREEGNKWTIGSYYRMDQTLPIKTMGLQLPVSTIYAGVNFTDGQ